MDVPAWALRLAAVLVTGLSMAGSTSYALAHPKNPNAPLQPPVAGRSAAPQDDPTPRPEPTATISATPPTAPVAPAAPATPTSTARASGSRTPTPRPTATPTPRPTPVPQITLNAGVRATALPQISYTHSS